MADSMLRTGDLNLPRDDRTFLLWFDKSAFRRPTSATVGTPSRNAILAPDFKSWDLSLFKNIPLGGDVRGCGSGSKRATRSITLSGRASMRPRTSIRRPAK